MNQRAPLRPFVVVILAACVALLALGDGGGASPGGFRTAAQQKVSGGARVNHLIDQFNKTFPSIDGRGVTAAVISNGAVLRTHVEFRGAAPGSASRVVNRTKKPVSLVGTHAAGVMAGRGGKPESKGMAPALHIIGLDWEGDAADLEREARRAQIAAHLYAPPAGWSLEPRTGGWIWWGDEAVDANEDANFGKYTDREARLDSVLYGSKKLSSFAPAGNDRNEGPKGEVPVAHFVARRDGAGHTTFVPVNGQRRAVDGGKSGGFDTLPGLCVAKNAICVGAIGDISISAPVSVEKYSGWGPADDGRVKPDLVASGHSVIAASEDGNDRYVRLSGTSTATSVAAGIAGLLAQLYSRERGGAGRTFPSADVLKAVMIHTATDVVSREAKEGPDPVSGWGSVNGLRAGEVIARKDAAGRFLHLLKTGQLSAGGMIPYALTPTGTGERIKVTLVWTDPPGAANRGGLNDRTPALVNDLDVRLVAPDGTVYYPYSLDPGEPLRPARRGGPNRVDNVEVIDGPRPRAGERWRVEVAARPLGAGNSQGYALIVSGLREAAGDEP